MKDRLGKTYCTCSEISTAEGSGGDTLRFGNLAEIRSIPKRCKIKERRGNEYNSDDALMSEHNSSTFL